MAINGYLALDYGLIIEVRQAFRKRAAKPILDERMVFEANTRLMSSSATSIR